MDREPRDVLGHVRRSIVSRAVASVFGPDKQLIPGAPEDALKQMARAAHSEKEKMRAEQERMRAEQEKVRLEEKNARLVEKLRSLGIHVDD